MVLLVPAMVLTGCSGGDDDVASSTTFAPPLTNPPLPTSPTSDEPSDDESTTTSPGPVDTTSPETTPDEGSSTTSSTVTVTSAPDDTTPDNSDWREIIQGLLLVFEELQADPRADRVDEFCAAGENDCQNVQGEAVRQFDEERWRAIGYPATTVIDATLSATANDDPVESAAFVVVSVTTAIPDFGDARVVDESGDLVFKIESSGGSGRANWLLAQDEGGAWRVLSIAGLD